jgi:signal transduction histidine kinase
VLAAALVWGATLRRQLTAQTRLLAAEMRSRRDAALEFEATLRERNRLAANLHDTLQQTIGGIGFQLDACEAAGGSHGAESSRHFAVARRMVGHAATELQGSV